MRLSRIPLRGLAISKSDLMLKKTQVLLLMSLSSKNRAVNFYYGSPDFELDFYIGRLGVEYKVDKDGFTSADLIF